LIYRPLKRNQQDKAGDWGKLVKRVLDQLPSIA